MAATATYTPVRPIKTTAPRGKQPTITAKGRLAELRTCVQLCLDALGEDHAKDIARRTGFCVSTAYRLIKGEVTLDMHVGTLQALGYAAGLRIEMSETKITMSLAK